MLSGPPELEDAIQGGFSYHALPTCGVFKLLCLGRGEHGDFTWGFRIYRATYKQTDSDSRFAKAIAVRAVKSCVGFPTIDEMIAGDARGLASAYKDCDKKP